MYTSNDKLLLYKNRSVSNGLVIFILGNMLIDNNGPVFKFKLNKHVRKKMTHRHETKIFSKYKFYDLNSKINLTLQFYLYVT